MGKKMLNLVPIIFVLIFLAGCGKKIPDGVSPEMYDLGKEAVTLTKDFLDEKESRKEVADKLIDLGKQAAGIYQNEYDEGIAGEKYYSDELIVKTILLIAQDMVTEDGDVESSLEILESLLSGQ